MTLDKQNSSNKLLTVLQQEYKILAEYKMIQSEDIGGVYVIPSYENSFLWFGVIFVRQGAYKEAVFRFNISLPDNFPGDGNPPKVIFQSEIFHPLICPYTRTLDISEAFPSWIENVTHLWQLLKYLQFIFIHPELCFSPNQKLANLEAAEILQRDEDKYNDKVKECVKLSIEQVYETAPTDDPHYIIFEKYDNDVHGQVLENMKKFKSVCPSLSPTPGLSWVKEGEFKALSKD